MPRQPTGRPLGRPPGSGQLANPARITVTLPGTMVARLEAYAAGRQLAACVRELLDRALASPAVSQTPLRRRKRQAASADPQRQEKSTDAGLL